MLARRMVSGFVPDAARISRHPNHLLVCPVASLKDRVVVLDPRCQHLYSWSPGEVLERLERFRVNGEL